MADSGKDGGGLLGDLPSHRPSVRTARRDAAGASARARAARPRDSGPPKPPSHPAAPEQRPSSAEQVVRTGAGLALAPARLGLRIAGRAVDGLGKAVGRR